MKKFLYTLLIIFCLIGCSSPKISEINYGQVNTTYINSQVINAEKFILKRNDFNLKCKEFGISSNLKKWKSSSFNDFETGKSIKEFVFLKNLDEQREIISDIYRTNLEINGSDTTFILIHRQTSYKK